jgi:hypothetical protein
VTRQPVKSSAHADIIDTTFYVCRDEPDKALNLLQLYLNMRAWDKLVLTGREYRTLNY